MRLRIPLVTGASRAPRLLLASALMLGAVAACRDRDVDAATKRRAGGRVAADTGPGAPEDSARAAARAWGELVESRCHSSAAFAAARADTARADSIRADTRRADSVRAAARADSVARADSAARAASAMRREATAAAARRARQHTRRAPARRAAAKDPGPPPYPGPVAPDSMWRPLAGALIPGCRVVAYYGNPLSKRMGILGELPPATMLDRLASQAAAYAAADSATPVFPALELIAIVAQGGPGRDSLYRMRMTDSLIERVARLAESKGYLLILDVQPGRSGMLAEVKSIQRYLERPYVHLALDPEFTMQRGRVPGKVIGTVDAATINEVSRWLSDLVAAQGLPPKMLVIHRFTAPMVTEQHRIRIDPRVQIVMDMDGFGPPWMKYKSYEKYIRDRPVQYTGFKLFYKNDRPLLEAHQVLRLVPAPYFIMYQ